jgi:HD-like signal output (HDOD) protein
LYGSLRPSSSDDMTIQQTAAYPFVVDLAQRLDNGTLELPPCPQIALEIRGLLERDDVSVDQIARLALLDPVLAAAVLKLANSAMFSRSASPTTDVKAAINRIGFDMVRNLAFDLAIAKAFQLEAIPRLRALTREIRTHSRHVAVLAYFLAKRFASTAPIGANDAMLAGLLHSIGKLYILARVDGFPELLADRDALEQLLRDWHADIGREILESWRLPRAVVVAVDQYERLNLTHSGPISVAEVLLAANLLSRLSAADETTLVSEISNVPALARLSLDEAKCRALIDQSQSMVDSVDAALRS